MVAAGWDMDNALIEGAGAGGRVEDVWRCLACASSARRDSLWRAVYVAHRIDVRRPRGRVREALRATVKLPSPARF